MPDEFAVELFVDSALGEELVVGAAFGDATMAQYENLMRMADGGKAMSDDEAGALFEEFFQRSLNEGFGVRIDRAGSFVEDQNARISSHGPREGD